MRKFTIGCSADIGCSGVCNHSIRQFVALVDEMSLLEFSSDIAPSMLQSYWILEGRKMSQGRESLKELFECTWRPDLKVSAG